MGNKHTDTSVKTMGKPKKNSPYSLKLMAIWIGVFAAIGVATLLLTKAATPGIPVTVDSSLPDPTNVKTYGDDQTATITWDKPTNADTAGIVGYYVTWGAQSAGVYTNAKQTIHEITQIQPLTNGSLYNVKVQAVHGSVIQVPTPNAWGGGSADEARGDGRVSSGAIATVTPSSARIDQLRTQMTGFFDDFKTSAGALDELKWNTATSGCAGYGSTGAFINNQFHAHTQVRTVTEDIRYCDRSENIARARGVFDISGKTEADPGVVVADFDGAISGRDRWYIDLIPLSARQNNTPLDITSHADAFDASPSDPAMIRLLQSGPGIALKYTGNDKQPNQMNYLFDICPDFKSDLDLQWCNQNVPPNISAFPEPPLIPFHGQFPIANVRYHWRVEVSPTKVKVFLNGVKLLEGAMPADFANVKKYTVQSNLFSYNTGKDQAEKEQTSILHWDNFGFNGPAQSSVTHNYIDGSSTGTQPVIGTGTLANRVEEDDRTSKINIPDSIGSPKEARLMYTLTELGYQNYVWDPANTVTINGTPVPIPDPHTQEQAPHVNDPIADAYHPFAETIVINPSLLKTGVNTVAFKIDNSTDIINLHIELEYSKGTEPSYSTPTTIFGASTLLTNIQPTLLSHDSYIFIEQDMGLPSGVIDGTTPIPNPPPTGDTTKPVITLNSPSNNTTVSGSSFNASASATDNVGVTKVEFYIGNSLKGTSTTSPYSANLSTAGLSPGTYTVSAIAYDAAGNTATSTSNSIIIPTPPDTTAPNINMVAPQVNASLSGSQVSLSAGTTSTDVTKVEFYIDSTLISTDTSSPYSSILDSTKQTNGSHTLVAKAYDAAGNVGTSASVTVTVNNAVADTIPPTVAISAPLANATISGTLAFIQATANDAGGINRVEFYIDGTLLGADNAFPYSFGLNTTLYNNGAHSLSAKAFDNSNNQTTSTQIAITINNPDTIPPSVVITAPFNNTTISGTYNVSVTANDAVGVNRVEFSVDGGGTVSSDNTNPYSYSWDTTKLTNAVHTIKATAFDGAGNSNSATATVTINNTTPPTVKRCDFNNDTFVDTNDLFILLANFNKTVPNGTKGDCNGNGFVDINDLFILLGVYGK